MDESKNSALTVVTPFWGRLYSLAHCIDQVERQTLANIQHIIVSDGPNRGAERLAEASGRTYLELPQRLGDWGRPAIDAALPHIRSEFFVVWYHTHLYPPDAAHSIYSMIGGWDLIVYRIRFWKPIAAEEGILPKTWDGAIRVGDVDLANCCIRTRFLRDTGLTPGTAAPGNRSADGIFLKKMTETGARVCFREELVLTHYDGISAWDANGMDHIATRRLRL